MNITKKNLLFILIIMLASVLRLYYIGSIPQGTTNDEAGYMYSAYSIWKTGYDVSGKYLPLSINLDNSFSPVYIYTIAPSVGFFGLSPLAGRLPFALAGITTVAGVYFLTKQLTGNKMIVMLSMLVFAISPWHIQISRGAFDATFALCFTLWATIVFLAKVKKGSILLSLPLFLLAFYSYHATKVYIIALVIVLLAFYFRDLCRRRIECITFIGGMVMIVVSFLYISKTQAITRQQVFFWNNTDNIVKTVNWERDRNTAPFSIRGIFSNKALYLGRVIRENYLEAFSTNYLFLYGETGGLGGTYGTFERGELYIIELPLLIFGFIFIFKDKNRKMAWFVVCLLAIAPLPSALTIDKTYVMRSVMMIPFLSIIISCGIFFTTQKIARYRGIKRSILFTCFVALYTFLFLSYTYQYFFRYNVYGAESWFKSSRDLAVYIGEHKNDYNTVIVANTGNMFFMQYGLYNKIEPELIQKVWQIKGNKSIENVHFVENCLDVPYRQVLHSLPARTLYIVPNHCHQGLVTNKKIVDMGESLRTIWKIYESK